VAAIVIVESNGITCATRYEPRYRYTTHPHIYASNIGITPGTEEIHQKTSWGLMQVMGGLARELGHTTHLTELCDPVVGLNYGCKYIKRLQETYDKRTDVISAYNQGSPRKTKGGFYRNEAYVDKVSSYIRELEAVYTND